MGIIKTEEQRTVIQQQANWYTGRWWVSCYIWYSEDGLGGAAARPGSSMLYTKCNSPPIKSQYANFILFDVM